MAATLEQVRQADQHAEEKSQADLQHPRKELHDAQALQQATQAAELKRILDDRAQEDRAQREQTHCQWQQLTDASTENTRRFSQIKHQQPESRREQARMTETSQGTQLILTDILRKLSELSTNNRIAQTPNQSPDHVYPPAPNAPVDWDTSAQLLPTHMRNAQLQYRDRAIYDTTETRQVEHIRPTIIQNFLREFRQIKQRDPHASDFPHYRSTDLAPDPSRIDYQSVYLPTVLNLTLQLATLGSQPIPTDPLFPGTIETQTTHHRNWSLLSDRMASPTPEPEELESSRQVWAITN
jgi:hypothetical protein